MVQWNSKGLIGGIFENFQVSIPQGLPEVNFSIRKV